MESELISRKANLRLDDLICLRCSVQTTSQTGSVCELCKALGKSIDPASKNGIWSDISFGGICAKRFIFGLNADRHLDGQFSAGQEVNNEIWV